MPAAQVKIQTRDRSATVTSLSGVKVGSVVNSEWGSSKPTFVSSPAELVREFGNYDIARGSSYKGAEVLSSQSNSLWLTRAIGDNSRHAATLVRSEVTATDYNTFQDSATTTTDPIVKAIATGIALDNVKNYNFPVYPATRVYSDTTIDVINVTGKEVSVNKILKGDGNPVAPGDVLSFGTVLPTNASSIYEVEKAEQIASTDHIVTLGHNITVTDGIELLHYAGNDLTQLPVSYPVVVKIKGNYAATNQIQVDDSDLIGNTDIVVPADQVPAINTAVAGTNVFQVTAKATSTLNSFKITLTTTPVGVAAADSVYKQESGDTKFKDSILVIGKYVGEYGNRIKVGIETLTDFTDSFTVVVYFDGVKVESFACSKKFQLDGFGTQMYVEEVINDKSNYIWVKDNNAQPAVPSTTDYADWLRNSDEIFGEVIAGDVDVVENILIGDDEFKVDSHANLSIGSRIKIGVNTNSEYKILVKGNDGVNDFVKVDRGAIEAYVPTNSVLLFDVNYQNAPTGVVNGKQLHKITKVSPVSNKSIGDIYAIGSFNGKLLDAGWNNTLGGLTTPVTVANMVAAFTKMSASDRFRVNAFVDNGFAFPAVALEINRICKLTDVAHGYLSIPYNLELSTDAVGAYIAYANGLNLNSEYVSVFSDSVKQLDVTTQTNVWIPPSVIGVNAQSFVSRQYTLFTPGAGWIFGRVSGLDLNNLHTQGDLDRLIDEANINPVKWETGVGLAIWGNITQYRKASPLQDRSVAWLLIIMRAGLRDYLKFELFQQHVPSVYRRIESTISTFIRTRLVDTGGVDEFQVLVEDIVTSQDIDERHLPIFIGLKPTGYINTITASLNIFNHSLDITVN
jgi:hypothetical protein